MLAAVIGGILADPGKKLTLYAPSVLLTFIQGNAFTDSQLLDDGQKDFRQALVGSDHVHIGFPVDFGLTDAFKRHALPQIGQPGLYAAARALVQQPIGFLVHIPDVFRAAHALGDFGNDMRHLFAPLEYVGGILQGQPDSFDG